VRPSYGGRTHRRGARTSRIAPGQPFVGDPTPRGRWHRFSHVHRLPGDPAVKGPRDRHGRVLVGGAEASSGGGGGGGGEREGERGGGGRGAAERGAERGGGGALLGLDVVLLADGLVGHGGRAAAPLLAVGALAAEVLRHGRHPRRRRAGSPRRRGSRVWGVREAGRRGQSE